MMLISDNIQKTLRDAFSLWKKTLYKTTEFQFLFKIFYIFVFFWIISFLLSRAIDLVHFLSGQISRGIPLDNISITSGVNEFALIIGTSLTLFVIFYVYHLEKNGVTIITGEYFRNHYISFVRTLLVAIIRTPLFIVRRIREMRTIILILILFLAMQKGLSYLSVGTDVTLAFSLMITIYGIVIYFVILLRRSFTSHITCLEPQEDPYDFNKKISRSFIKKRFIITLIFYVILFSVMTIWLAIFSFFAYMIFVSETYIHDITSLIMATFVSFSIVSLAVVLSLLKSFKSCIMTVLYYQQRGKQNRSITFLKQKKPPFHARNPINAIILLIIPIIIGSILLTTSIKSRTDTLLDRTQNFAPPENNVQLNDIEQISLEKFTESALSRDKNILKTIEQYILQYLVYIDQREK